MHVLNQENAWLACVVIILSKKNNICVLGDCMCAFILKARKRYRKDCLDLQT